MQIWKNYLYQTFSLHSIAHLEVYLFKLLLYARPFFKVCNKISCVFLFLSTNVSFLLLSPL